MQSSSLPAAAMPLVSLLEPAQCEATPVVTAEASPSGAFETVINQAVGEAVDNSKPSEGLGGNTQTANTTKMPTVTPFVGGENESDSEETVDSKTSEKGSAEEAKGNLVCVFSEALACNLLLQVTPVPVVNTPGPVATEPAPLPAGNELVPEQTTARRLSSEPVGTQSQDVRTIPPANGQGADANLKNPLLTAAEQKAFGTPTPVQSKEAIAKALTPFPVPEPQPRVESPTPFESKEVIAKALTPLPVPEPQPKVESPIPVQSKEAIAKALTPFPISEPQPKVEPTSRAVKQEATSVENSENVVMAETKPQVTITAAMPRANAMPKVEGNSQALKPQPNPKIVLPEGQPTNEVTNLSPPEADGTSTAKSTQRMQNAAETGRRMQSLPGKIGKPATLTQSVDAAPAKTPAPVSNETATPSPRGDVSLFTADAVPVATEQVTKGFNSRATLNVEQVEGQIRTQVIELKRIGSDSMSVVLKPDGQVELHLQLRMERGQVHVVAECKRGDVAALNESWGQLQQNLAGQGIRVSALQDGSGTNLANGNWTGQFQRQGWQDQQKWEGPSYRYFGEEEKNTGGHSSSTQKGKGANASAKAGEKRALEMWA